MDAEGNLYVKYGEEGTATLLLNIKGPKGDKGDTGADGAQGPQGEQGPAGANGTNGVDGTGIAEITMEEGKLVILYTDDTTAEFDLSEVLEAGKSNVITDGLLEYVPLSDGTYGVKAGASAQYAKKITVPQKYNDIVVTVVLNNGFAGLSGLEGVVLPEGVTVIGANAFYQCSALNKVDLPDSLVSIKQYAFYQCESLTSVEIPAAVKFLGKKCFFGSGLQSMNMSLTGNWTISNVVTSDTAWSDVGTVTTYSVTNNGTTTFTYRTNNTYSANSEAKISAMFTKNIYAGPSGYGYYLKLFESDWVCEGYTDPSGDVEAIPEGSEVLAGIRDVVVSDDGKLVVTLLDGTVKIAGDVKGEKGEPGVGITKTEIIDGCLWITYSNDPENPVNVGTLEESKSTMDGHFAYVRLDDGTYGIKASSTFSLTSVDIPATYNGIAVTQIMDNGFENQTGITAVTFPDSLKRIGRHAFRGCTGLTAVEIPAAVEFIGAYAFYKAGLTSATLNSTEWMPSCIDGFSYIYYIFVSGSGYRPDLYSYSLNNESAANALVGPVSVEYRRWASDITYQDKHWYAVDWTRTE